MLGSSRCTDFSSQKSKSGVSVNIVDISVLSLYLICSCLAGGFPNRSGRLIGYDCMF